MRRVRYQVACSLDGYIAGPNGEIDWITGAEEFDFGALYSQFDTLLMGRRTWETLQGGAGGFGGMRIVVGSSTLEPSAGRGVEIVRDMAARVEELRSGAGKDLWLFGGGGLFRTLLAAGQVDAIEPAVIPVVLGGGVPMYPPPFPRTRLRLTGHRAYEKGGMMLLEYAVAGGRGGGGAT